MRPRVRHEVLNNSVIVSKAILWDPAEHKTDTTVVNPKTLHGAVSKKGTHLHNERDCICFPNVQPYALERDHKLRHAYISSVCLAASQAAQDKYNSEGAKRALKEQKHQEIYNSNPNLLPCSFIMETKPQSEGSISKGFESRKITFTWLEHPLLLTATELAILWPHSLTTNLAYAVKGARSKVIFSAIGPIENWTLF